MGQARIGIANGISSVMGFHPGLVRRLDRVIVALEDGTLPGPFQTDG